MVSFHITIHHHCTIRTTPPARYDNAQTPPQNDLHTQQLGTQLSPSAYYVPHQMNLRIRPYLDLRVIRLVARLFRRTTSPSHFINLTGHL